MCWLSITLADIHDTPGILLERGREEGGGREEFCPVNWRAPPNK
jgi:hypothetical protein